MWDWPDADADAAPAPAPPAAQGPLEELANALLVFLGYHDTVTVTVDGSTANEVLMRAAAGVLLAAVLLMVLPGLIVWLRERLWILLRLTASVVAVVVLVLAVLFPRPFVRLAGGR